MKCPCCDQEIPERHDLLFSDSWRAVVRFGIVVELSPIQYQIMQAVRRRNRTNEELVEFIYADRSDGGPDTAKNCIHVAIAAMNKKLKRINLKVGSERVGPHTPIKLMELGVANGR